MPRQLDVGSCGNLYPRTETQYASPHSERKHDGAWRPGPADRNRGQTLSRRCRSRLGPPSSLRTGLVHCQQRTDGSRSCVPGTHTNSKSLRGNANNGKTPSLARSPLHGATLPWPRFWACACGPGRIIEGIGSRTCVRTFYGARANARIIFIYLHLGALDEYDDG